MAQPKRKSTAQEAPAKTKEVKPLLDKPIKLGRAKALTVSRFKLAEEVRHEWVVTCDMDTTPEQVMLEGFYANISMLLTPGDIITVMPDNMAWKRLLHVAGCGNLYAHVILLEHYDLTPSTPPIKLPSIYKVEWAGSHHKWRVLREGNMLRDGFATEPLARRYAANHEAAVQR